MRFSFWASTGQSWDDLLEPCRHVADAGWDGIWVADHFISVSGDFDDPLLEAWGVLGGLAAAVPRVRLGTLVCGNTYRHPAVLANQAATVDEVGGGGRVVLGIGAGWQENEHVAYGIELGTVAWRMGRFEEACEILRSLLDEKRTDFSGRHYTLTDAPLSPKGDMKLLVGGGGEKRTLRAAARFADEWNVWGDPEIMRHKMAILDRHCEDAGRDPSAVERSAVALLFLSEDESWLSGLRDRDFGRPVVVGTPAEAREVIAQHAELGVDEFIVPDFTLGQGSQRLDTLDLFWSEVAPDFR
jgi:F420-dependent oxidoreductase-like protein